MSYSIIAAIGKNNELGKDNGLIWHLPGDLKFFKETTTGKTIIMGRKTFESLPRMLPNRHHIVISRCNNFPSEVEVYNSLEDLLDAKKGIDEELFVIGGASIYKLFLDYSDKLYLTEIDAECKDADAYFPSFNKEEWDKEELFSNEDNDISYKHVLYKRKK
ncbi:MAG: dihydrofolate reductase [Bacilli bacterium]|nr:dihydrofolate reductase [Bacilli bacterium]